jgi:signal transduction histidine kinase
MCRPPLPAGDGRRGSAHQLLQNLVGNALKFRSEAPPRIRISAVRAGEAWRFAVADNGIGIEPQYSERIFQMFQRLHERGRYEGSGIGLSIVKRILERHGGRIWLQSTPGQGSTFFFTLPALAPTAEGP